MNIQEALGILAIAVGFFGIAPYIFSFIKGKTKPHAYSWLAWGILGMVQFAGMSGAHAGPASWVHASTSITYLCIGIAALKWGHTERKTSDYVAFSLCILAGVVLLFVQNYFLALVIALVADATAFYPTIRKVWRHPYAEDHSAYWIGSLMFLCAIGGLEQHTLTTMITPVALATLNGLAALYIIIRRAQLKP